MGKVNNSVWKLRKTKQNKNIIKSASTQYKHNLNEILNNKVARLSEARRVIIRRVIICSLVVKKKSKKNK